MKRARMLKIVERMMTRTNDADDSDSVRVMMVNDSDRRSLIYIGTVRPCHKSWGLITTFPTKKPFPAGPHKNQRANRNGDYHHRGAAAAAACGHAGNDAAAALYVHLNPAGRLRRIVTYPFAARPCWSGSPYAFVRPRTSRAGLGEIRLEEPSKIPRQLGGRTKRCWGPRQAAGPDQNQKHRRENETT